MAKRPNPKAATVDATTEIQRLLGGFASDGRHKATSLRLNQSLWDAAEVAVRLGWAPSLTALVEQGVAGHLTELTSMVVEQMALDEHYARHPDARSDLWEIAVAAARLDGSRLADRPDLVRSAVDALGAAADVDTVLAWAAGVHSAASGSAATR